MTLTIDQIKMMQREIAQIMAVSADKPTEFVEKLEQLMIEWYLKGLEDGVEMERSMKWIKKS